MKIKINHIVILLLLSIFGLTGCYDDKSKLADSPIEGIIIDTTGISFKQFIGYQEELILSPQIKSSPEELQYEWVLTETPGNEGKREVISAEKDLHYLMTRPASITPYYLQFTITDNKKLQYSCVWEVYVQSTFSSGLLIADSENGLSDFTYIRNKTVSENYDKEEKIFRQILMNANGLPYQGDITSLTYQCFGGKTNQVWAITKEGFCSRFNTIDFSENGNSDSESLLPFKPTGFKFISFFKAYQRFFANTNNGIYVLSPNAANIFSVPDIAAKGYTINNNICANNTNEYNTNDFAVWLDKQKGAFIAYHAPTFSQFTCNTYQKNNIFDPNELQNYSAIAANTTENGKQTIFCLRDDNTGAYTIYTLTNYVAAILQWDENLQDYVEILPEEKESAQSMFMIPEEGKALLDQAVSVFFAKKENVLYVATPNGIYSIIYGMGSTATVNTVAKFTPASGEKITLAKLFQQGYYTRDSNQIIGENPSIPELPWNNKAIIVATQKSDTEGKAYVIPMTQLGTGNLDISKALQYDGFNKINDIITISY